MARFGLPGRAGQGLHEGERQRPAVLAPGFAALAVEGVTLAGIQVWKDLMQVGQRVGRQHPQSVDASRRFRACTVSAMRCLPPRPAMSAAISFGNSDP